MYQEPEAFRYIPRLKGMNEDDYRSFFASRLQWVHSSQGYYWAARSIEDGSLIGALNLYPHHEPGILHLGCQIKQRYWGQGYATEMMKAGRDFGIYQLGLAAIYAFVDTRNLASIHLLEKLNFVQLIDDSTNSLSSTAVYKYSHLN